MKRLLFSFILALGCHLLIFVLLPQLHNSSPLPPQKMGSYRVRLSIQHEIQKPVQPLPAPSKPVEEKQQLKQTPLSPVETQKEMQPKKPLPIKHIPASTKKTIHPSPQKKQASHKPDKVPQISTATKIETIPQSQQGNSQPAHKPAPAAPAVIKAKPFYLQNKEPIYPKLARKRGWQGTTILAATISEKGTVTQIRIHTSSGHKILDNAAFETVAHWTFVPGSDNGIPVVTEIRIPIHFVLKN